MKCQLSTWTKVTQNFQSFIYLCFSSFHYHCVDLFACFHFVSLQNLFENQNNKQLHFICAYPLHTLSCHLFSILLVLDFRWLHYQVGFGPSNSSGMTPPSPKYTSLTWHDGKSMLQVNMFWLIDALFDVEWLISNYFSKLYEFIICLISIC